MAYGVVTILVLSRKGAEFPAPFLLPSSISGSRCEGAGEGAEILALPASITISITLLLASRFVSEIARM